MNSSSAAHCHRSRAADRIAYCGRTSLAQAPTATFAQPGWGSGATLQLRADGAAGCCSLQGFATRSASRCVTTRRTVTSRAKGADAGDHRELERATGESSIAIVRDSSWPRAYQQTARNFLSRGAQSRLQDEFARRAGVPMVGWSRRQRVSDFIALDLRDSDDRGTRIVGWRNHRLISVASGRPIGDPVGLGFGSSDPTPCSSWSRPRCSRRGQDRVLSHDSTRQFRIAKRAP